MTDDSRRRILFRIIITSLVFILLQSFSFANELKFTHRKSGKITTFKVGDRIGYSLKGWSFPDKRSGILEDFNTIYFTVNNNTYPLDRLEHIRHFKPLLSFILTFLGIFAAIITGVYLAFLLIPVAGKMVTPFFIFLFLSQGLMISERILVGKYVYTNRHNIEFIQSTDQDVIKP